MAVADASWTRADAYYFRNISRVQRLWQAAKAPHPDLSGGEVQASQRFAEHILHLQRNQRRNLRSAWEVHDAILHVMQLTDSIGALKEGSSCPVLASILPRAEFFSRESSDRPT